jgi:hypothetical protein
VTILGNARHACGNPCAGTGGDLAAGDTNAARVRRAHAEQHVRERLLAVARDAGNRRDFPCAKRQRDVVERAVDADTAHLADDVPPARAASQQGAGTSRPTIRCASVARSASAAGIVATSLPLRSTAMRCDTRSTSASLWLMKMIDKPSATSSPSVAKSDSDSCGVSTAVGSSRISTRASRVSAFRISTRCRSPTERLPTRASGFTRNPNRSAVASSLRRASRRRDAGRHNASVPSITLSCTDRLSASVKCWCTIPMPAASAAAGSPCGSGVPNASIDPASGT